MRGILIDIEGLDGSGKETQAQLLYNYINDKIPEKVVYASFPNYESNSSALVKMYLNGEFGSDPFNVNAYAASSFFAVDRFSSFKKEWQKDYENGKWIIANRYTSSNFLYQMPKVEKSRWDSYLEWIHDYEYDKLGLPRPDEVIYLDVPIEVSQELMNKRYKGDLSKKDLHEANLDFLRMCQKAAEYTSVRCGWNVIKCVENGQLKPMEEIHQEIVLIIKNKIQKLLKFIES